MAQAVPVIATDQGSHRDYLSPQGGKPAGILVASDGPDAWADALLELLQNPRLCRDLGAEGRRRVCTDLSWSHTAREILRPFEHHIGG